MNNLVDNLLRCLETHDREGAVRGRPLGGRRRALHRGPPHPGARSRSWGLCGMRWCEGRAAVWEEHLIVGAVRAAVEALYPVVLERKARVKPVPVTVAFFCPPEETHESRTAHAVRPLRPARLPHRLRWRPDPGRSDGGVRAGDRRRGGLPLGLDSLPAERAE